MPALDQLFCAPSNVQEYIASYSHLFLGGIVVYVGVQISVITLFMLVSFARLCVCNELN